MLEERLKSDVISEIDAFQGRVLLHTESPDGEVVPVWETVDKADVHSLREVMADVAESELDVKLNFVRIPITSESSPDVSVLDPVEVADVLTRVVSRLDPAPRSVPAH